MKTLLTMLAIALLCPAVGAQEADLQQPNIMAKAFATAQSKCVKIYGGAIGREHGYATGVLISEDGYILTASGVYLSGERIRVVLPNGEMHFAQVQREDEGLQIALLKIDALTPDYFLIRQQPIARSGEWVLAVSNAFNVASGSEPLGANLGIVAMRAELDTKKRNQDFDVRGEVLLVDAMTSNPGSPGGALLTVNGELAGLVGKVLESQATNTRLNYAVPNDLLAAFVKGDTQIQQAGDEQPVATGKADLGIRIFTLSGRRAPAYIDSVVTGSPAHKAGLMKDDLVLEINDEWIRYVRDYTAIADALRPGDKVDLTVKRGDDIIRVQLTAQKVNQPDAQPQPQEQAP